MILNILMMLAGLILAVIAFMDYYSGEIANACFWMLIASVNITVLAVRSKPNICYNNCHITFSPPENVRVNTEDA